MTIDRLLDLESSLVDDHEADVDTYDSLITSRRAGYCQHAMVAERGAEATASGL